MVCWDTNAYHRHGECTQPEPGHGGIDRVNRLMEVPVCPEHFKYAQNPKIKPIKGDHCLTHNNENNHQDDRRVRIQCQDYNPT